MPLVHVEPIKSCQKVEAPWICQWYLMSTQMGETNNYFMTNTLANAGPWPRSLNNKSPVASTRSLATLYTPKTPAKT